MVLYISGIALFAVNYINGPYLQTTRASAATLTPNANGYISSVTFSGCSTQYQCVLTNDGGTSFIGSGAGTTNSAFTFANPNVPSGATIQNVTVYSYSASAVAGASAFTYLMVYTTANTTAYFSGAKSVTTTAYSQVSNAWATNPATGAAWTPAVVNSGLQIGIRLTKDAGISRSSQVWAVVNYTLAPPSAPTITAPNGGESWSSGTSNNVTWDTAGSGLKYQVEAQNMTQYDNFNDNSLDAAKWTKTNEGNNVTISETGSEIKISGTNSSGSIIYPGVNSADATAVASQIFQTKFKAATDATGSIAYAFEARKADSSRKIQIGYSASGWSLGYYNGSTWSYVPSPYLVIGNESSEYKTLKIVLNLAINRADGFVSDADGTEHFVGSISIAGIAVGDSIEGRLMASAPSAVAIDGRFDDYVVYPVDDLLADNFDSYTNGSSINSQGGWTTAGETTYGTYTVSNAQSVSTSNSLLLTKNTTSGSLTASQSLDNYNNTIITELDCRPAQTTSVTQYTTRGSGGAAAVIRFQNTGYITALNGVGSSDTNLQTYTANTWYHVKIVSDPQRQKYDLYVNGTLVAQNYGFFTANSVLTSFQIASSGTAAGTSYTDNFQIYSDFKTINGLTAADAVLYSWDNTGWATGTNYLVRARAYDTTSNLFGPYDYSDATFAITSGPSVPSTPSISTPTDSATGISINPSAISSVYSGYGTHSSSDWEIYNNSDLASGNRVWYKEDDTTNKTSITVSSTNGTFENALSGQTALAFSTDYWVRVRHTNSVGDSSWSTAIKFTTRAVGITVSGTAYTNEAKSTNIGANKTVAISINGGTKATTETDSDGAFSFSDQLATANGTLALFLDDETEKASFVTQTADTTSNITSIEMYTEKVVLTHQTAGPMTNTLLDTVDNVSDTDILASVSSGNATFTDGNEVYILSGKTYTPGGTVTLHDLEVTGTGAFSPSSNLVNVTGSWKIATGATLTTSNTTTFNASSGTETIDAGGADASHQFGSLTKVGGGVLQLTSTALKATGTVSVSTSTTLDINGQNLDIATLSSDGTLKLTGDETVNITTFDSDSGTVEYSATSGARNVMDKSYYILKINGSGGTFRIPATATTTIAANLDIAAGTFDTNDGSTDRSLTVNGNITVTGTLNANNSTITCLGNFDVSGGTFNKGTSTILMKGTGNISSGSQQLYNLHVSSTSSSVAPTYVSGAGVGTMTPGISSLAMNSSSLGTITSGNLLLAACHLPSSSGSGFAISGWTKIREFTGTNLGIAYFYKYATGSEPGTYTCTYTGTGVSSLVIVQYTNTASTSPIDTDAEVLEKTSAGTSYPTNSISASTINDTIVSIHSENYPTGSMTNQYAWTNPSGSTKQFEFDNKTNSPNYYNSWTLFDEAISSPFSGTKTATETKWSSASAGQAYILAIKPAGTTANSTIATNGNVVVSGTLTNDANQTLSISTGNTITMANNSTASNSGTISGAGTLELIDSAGANLSTSGTLSSITRFTTAAANAVVPARTYGGAVEFYSNSGSDYSVTLGTATSQTLSFSNNFTVLANSTGNISVTADTYSPTINISGDIAMMAASTGKPQIYGGNSTWSIGGNVDISAGTLYKNSSTFAFTKATGTQTLNAGGVTNEFYNLTHSGAGTLQLLSNPIVISYDFNNSNGVFDANGYNISIGKNWNISAGSFSSGATPGAQTVVFNTANTSVISGSTTFNNLTMDSSTDGAKEIDFSAGTTQTINGTWVLNGASGKILTLRSTATDSAWYFVMGANMVSGDFIDVRDSQNTTNSYRITPGADVTNSGNNSPGWLFGSPPTNDSVIFTNPYSGSSNQSIADNTTEWNFEVKVSDLSGSTDLNYVEIRLANNSDGSSPFDSIKFRWTEATDAFSEEADTQNAFTLTSTASDSNVSGSQWTLNFKVKISDSFSSKDTQYNLEVYSIDDGGYSDSGSVSNFYQVSSLALDLDLSVDTINFGDLTPGAPLLGYLTITVSANHPNGYSLSIQDNTANSKSSMLHTDTTTYIDDYAGSIDSPSLWDGYGLGFSLYSGTSKESKWGSGTTYDDTNNKYAGVPENTTIFHVKNGAPTASNETNLSFKVNLPNGQKIGNYSGVIVITALGLLE